MAEVIAGLKRRPGSMGEGRSDGEASNSSFPPAGNEAGRVTPVTDWALRTLELSGAAFNPMNTWNNKLMRTN